MTVFDRTIIRIDRYRRNNHCNNKNSFKYSALFCKKRSEQSNTRDRHRRKSDDNIIQGKERDNNLKFEKKII